MASPPLEWAWDGRWASGQANKLQKKGFNIKIVIYGFAQNVVFIQIWVLFFIRIYITRLQHGAPHPYSPKYTPCYTIPLPANGERVERWCLEKVLDGDHYFLLRTGPHSATIYTDTHLDGAAAAARFCAANIFHLTAILVAEEEEDFRKITQGIKMLEFVILILFGEGPGGRAWVGAVIGAVPAHSLGRY